MVICRSPHGERGLKYHQVQLLRHKSLSLSSRRAWIEIRARKHLHRNDLVALLTESVD